MTQNLTDFPLSTVNWTAQQSRLLASKTAGSLFVTGEAGMGKTTASAFFLRQRVLDEGKKQESFLVLLPQLTLSEPYQKALEGLPYEMSSRVSIRTMNGLARRMVSLFWPLISTQAGFQHPYRAPRFLNLETSQYYIAKIVEPMINQGAFSTVTLKRTLLYTQLLDNLNKSALVGFPYTDISSRLSGAWVGEGAQINVYQDVQYAITQFRDLCLRENLVDFSLQIELFNKYVWNEEIPKRYLTGMFQHLIYDNLEEDAPFAHDIIQNWLPHFRSALLIQDTNAGYRNFLGADPISAARFENLIDGSIHFVEAPGSSPGIQKLKQAFLDLREHKPASDNLSISELSDVLVLPRNQTRFFPQLMDQIAEAVARLIEKGVEPGEIVILAPFISDALSLGLSHRLEAKGIDSIVHRPTQPMVEQPAIQTMLTLIQLAHPEWKLFPSRLQLINSLVMSIDGLDLVRAHLLGKLYNADLGKLSLIGQLSQAEKARIPEFIAQRYDQLVTWFGDAGREEPLDVFLSRLFGELLSQRGFGFHADLAQGQSVARLIESYTKFVAVLSAPGAEALDPGAEFTRSLLSGLISALFTEDWMYRDPAKVLITPTLVFLMQNQTVDYQFWLQIGSSGWYTRLEQPLTHPYVLSRNWIEGQKWTYNEELDLARKNLSTTVQGLLTRCRKRVYTGLSTFDESGKEERGLLMNNIQTLYRQALRGIPHG